MVKNRVMMMKRRRRLLSSLRLRRTTTVSLHERFSQVLRNQLTKKLNINRGRLSRLHQARSHLRTTGLWTRLGWLNVTQQLCGFWSFKNKYGWRARFNRQRFRTQLGQRRFYETHNCRPLRAGRMGWGRQLKTRTFLMPATGQGDSEAGQGQSDDKAGLGPRCVTITGCMQSLTPVQTQLGPDLSGLHGSLTPVWCVPGLERGGALAAGGVDRWNTHMPTKSQLDAQLDEYMSMSKRRLDAELDEYMSMTPARLDAELDEYMSQAGQLLLD